MTLKNQLKLMSYSRLIDELYRLRDMYKNFSSNTDNTITIACFNMVCKDLETLLNKYDVRNDNRW